jgi:hypothetical protein
MTRLRQGAPARQEAELEKIRFAPQCYSRELRIFGKMFQIVLPNDK